jgi:hypothetical protein
MNRSLTRRLAADLTRRHDALVSAANGAAIAADRSIAAAWRDLLAVLKERHGFYADYLRAISALRRLTGGVIEAIGSRLRRVVALGFQTASRALRGTLPAYYLRTIGSHAAAELSIGGLPPRQPPRGNLLIPGEPDFGNWDDLLPPPSPETVERIVYGPARNGQDWRGRVASLSRLAPPDRLAGIVATGMSSGLTQQEIARAILPSVNHVRSSARRIARTEGVRVGHEVQMEAWESMGPDLVIGYQLHSALVEATRPWHAKRHLQIYYREPKAGQKGFDAMPRPPDEPPDPRERPIGTPATAPNCLCSLAPVMSEI